jgi:hypothetical protein
MTKNVKPRATKSRAGRNQTRKPTQEAEKYLEKAGAPNATSRQRNLGKVFDEFARELSALRQCFEVSSKALDDAKDDSAKKTTALLEKFRVSKTGKSVIAAIAKRPPKSEKKSSKTRLTIQFSEDEAGEVVRVLEKHIHALQATVVIRRSLLLASISQYDAFLAKLLEWLFLERPELLNASKKTVDYAEILRMGSFDELRASIIQEEIETFLRDSHSKQFDWLETRFSLKLRTDLVCWPTFVELTERRNLFAHGDGVVTSQYLKVCGDHGVGLPPEAANGTKLEISKDYLLQSIETLYEISIKLTQVLWRKMFPSELEEADTHLTMSTFYLIKDEQYPLAKKILDTFLFRTNKPLSSERTRRICILNYAQCLKWMGDQNACDLAISKEDWTACGPEFSLAVSVLKDDFKSAAHWMARIGKESPYRKIQYLEWPIFRHFKKSNEFLKQYEEIYGEPFEVVQSEEIERLNRIAESANVNPSDLDLTRLPSSKMH